MTPSRTSRSHTPRTPLLALGLLVACAPSRPDDAPAATPVVEPVPPPSPVHTAPGACVPIERDPLAATRHGRGDVPDACVRDPSVQHACADLWNNLRAGEIQAVPRTMRCRLAATLAEAAILSLTMARTRWWQFDTDVIHFAPLVGPRGGGIQPMIADDESCDPSEAPYLYPSSGAPEVKVKVETLGKADRPTKPELSLRLDGPQPDDDACAASFSWSLNQQLGAFHPRPAPLPSARVQIVKPAIRFNSAPAPTLVVDVQMEPSGTFSARSSLR